MPPSTTPDPAQDLVGKIESDIRKSGFPLEMFVLNVCSSKKTGRMPSVRYEYRDQLREIDLLTFFETIAASHHTKTALIIECKKSSEKPWVFFSTPAYRFDNVASFIKYNSEFDVYFRKRGLVPLLAQIYPGLKLGHYSDRSVPRCVSYYEAFRSTSAPSEIYRAIDSVITYLNYHRASRIQRSEEFGTFSEFYVPIIVVEGNLFEAKVELDKVRVCARPHLQLRTFHREDLYIIDIVSRDHFQQFFDQVSDFHDEIVRCIASLSFPNEFKAAARAKQKELQRSPDTDGSLTMAFARTGRKRRKLVKA
jgi:hypothetical protein